jgi:hypothetical protein|tara:strand:- start:913 stop:3228 length:2316 start_codon:yes stop_codon:yes gene_type:complete
MGYDKIPRQKMPISKKNKEWREACVEAYIDLSDQGTGYASHKDGLKRLYDYYNGVIEETDYKNVLKPYGKTRNNFPSQMRNYPIIKPIIDLLLGEKSKRPLNFSVVVKNADTISIKEEQKKEAIYKSLEQMFVNKMNEKGVDTGIDSENIELPKHVADQFEASYVDNRAIKGQSAMNYIMAEQEVEDKLNKAWFHFLVSGETYTHRGVRNSEPFYDIINPIDVDYDLDPDLEFVEDGDWALVRKYVHGSTVIDHYYDDLTDAQVLELEEPRHQEASSYLMHAASTGKDPNAYRNRLIEVINVYWKSRKRLGFITYFDEQTGEIEQMQVEDGFKLTDELKQAEAKLEWFWVNEVWEGTRIDGRMYINISPIANQRVSLDNFSTCKLPINGRRYSDVNSTNISLVKLGIPFQLTYNIYKYRLELAIARSKDIIAQFDINMIPKKWDMDKFMYYVEGTGIAWVDYNKEGIQLNPQHQTVMDMSIKTVAQYIQLLESIMLEWEKLSGVNRQRQGQIGAYEGKASSQQAIVQSSHITEDLFKKFNRMEERDMQALLDYSKEAWHTGKKTAFVMPDGTQEFLSLDTVEHMESNYGIFVTDSGKEQEKFDAIKVLSQSMVQNGVPASTVAEMIDADSFAVIKTKIKAAEKEMQELSSKQQDAQNQIEQAKLEGAKEVRDNDNMNKEKDRDTQIKVAMIHAEDNNTRVEVDQIKTVKEVGVKDKDSDTKRQAMEEVGRSNKANEDIKRAELNIKKKEAKTKSKDVDNKLKIAKQKPKTN